MAAACQEMDSMPERYLTLEEKAKLKERLALLKKEYKKTVHRLQRSQRAERVKTHIKKTIEEQNRLLSQELSKQDDVSVLSGPYTDVNNVTQKVTESAQSVDPPSADKERKPSVSFNLDPEILRGDKTSSSCSGSESGGQEPSTENKTEASASSSPNLGKRSRLRLNRSARRVCSEPTATSGPEAGGNPIEDGSTRGSALCLNADGPVKINRTASNPISDHTRRVQVPPECENHLDVNVQQHINIEGTNAPASPVFKKGLTEDFPMTVKSFSENIEHIYPEEKDALDTGQDITTYHSPDSSRSNMTQTGNVPAHTGTDHSQQTGGGTCQDPTLGATCDLSPFPRVVETSSTSPLCADNNRGGSPPMKEKRSPLLDSCTLVEGLLFPVEYYVRTTRRMTSCQRKVDLEAVINSQLGGTARKGARGKTRRASTSSTPSLQVSSIPRSAARSRRGRKSCPASVTSGFSNTSKQPEYSSDASPKGGGSEGVKETFLGKEMSSETSVDNPNMEEGEKKEEAVTEGREVSIIQDGDGYGLHVTEHTDGFQRRVYNLRTSAKTREPSSPFHLFGGRLNVLHLLYHSDSTDFHLPDEDFGLLKLEKLKSTSLLEPFVPEPTKQKKYYKRADGIDSSALLHGTAGVCTSASPELVTLVKANADSFLHNDLTTLRDNVPGPEHGGTAPEHGGTAPEHGGTAPLHGGTAPLHGGTTPQTLISRTTPEVAQYLLSKENDETFTPGSPVNHCLEQVFYGAPHPSAATYTNLQVSEPILHPPFGSLDPEDTMSGQGVVVSSTNMEPAVDTSSRSETKPPLSVPSPAKEVTCNVVLSTSMCSAPADAHTECVFSGCTPGLPMLGLTPAAFSSPAPYEEPAPPRTRSFCPEVSVPLNNKDELVAHDNVNAHQLSNLSSPPSGGDARGTAERKTCHQEHKGSKEGVTGGDRLRLVSEIKDACRGGPPVDLCSLWWDFSGGTDLCVVSASEYSVRLWRPQEVCEWKCVHTWSFPEIPVIQILPLFQEKNLVCVALGNVKIMEIWVLASDPELLIREKQLVKQGLTNTAQGLSRHRVVTASGEGDSQVVELWQLAENGSLAGSHALVAPKDSVVAFSEVDGERDALVGSTVVNNVVLWNSVSGHLLGAFHIGNICSDLTCVSATSDSGLLFLVVGSSLSKPREINGVFQLIATNPRGGASALIMAYTLPAGVSSRFREGDVKEQRAAAVLTCGSIALWDLSRSHCSAVLPPDRDAPWCLVRWGNRSSWLLAGRQDGSICVYGHTDCG